MLRTFWQDLKHGARMLAKQPGFSIVAIVSIAIGVGANAAMFSLADGLVLRPLPVPRAGDVMAVSTTTTTQIGFRNVRLSYPDYIDVRDHVRSFDNLVAYRIVITSFAHRADDPVQRKIGNAVSGNYFDEMAVRPALGRSFLPEEDRVPGRDAVVILDHDEWTQQFGADPGIVNRRIRIGEIEFTVVGVAPPGFTSIDHDVHPAFYVPLAMFASVQNGSPPDWLNDRSQRTLTVMGRLRSGATLEQARQEVQQIGGGLQRSYPDTHRNLGLTVQTPLDAYGAATGGTDQRLVLMLMTLAFVVLVVASANVAGLLLSRAPLRAREMALRTAIGAGRHRLLRQLVTESLLIAVVGGCLGIAFGYGVIVLFQQLEFPTDIPLKLTFALDRRVLFVGITVAAASAILSSLVPAWRATRVDLVSVLKAPASSEGRRSRLWGRSTLVCGQVALSLVLLAVSAFLYRAFQSELDRGPGFRTDGLLMMTFEPGLARYDDARTRGFYRLLTERALATPGVTSAALTSGVPMKASTIQITLVAPEGFQFPPGAENAPVPSARIDEGYLDTMNIPIVSGRGFESTDTADTARVAIVNETFATRYWPGQSAIGKRVRIDGFDSGVVEVVGVAANAKYFFIVESPVAFIYLAHRQTTAPQMTLIVGTDRDAAAMSGSLREVVRSIDPNMPVFGIRTMEDFYASRVLHTTRLIVGSVSGMGSAGLVLAIVGLYGLVAYAASRRTREIGIRIAVGATQGSVLRMVLRHGVVLAAAGIVMGVAGAAAANNLLRAFFASTPVNLGSGGGNDLVSYALLVVAVVTVVIVAAYIPARRAAGIDPIVALREE